MKRTLTSLPLVAALAVAASGCAQPPTAAVDSARMALEAARSAEAGDYAPASLADAESAFAAIDAELEAQQEKFALTRSYQKAVELAAHARAAAEKAAADAVTGKETARTEAISQIAALRTSVEEVRALLAKAPTGKGSAADIEAMKVDLTGVETSLGELDAVFANGKFKTARTQAEAARQVMDRIKGDIQMAMEAKQAGKRRG